MMSSCGGIVHYRQIGASYVVMLLFFVKRKCKIKEKKL